ncbi:hsp20-like protein [Emericellopsis atlantica]|uniref:Hsp20-like protein n=1 Tax=Emericellopsis atlantica TaxID=2614577 RepID=A0A9P8CMQ7_9HYPO|nr:hsp20-like protein [Emericellopsis atlantica]KAG9252372.1 hsp20-like protein [Emericellopsis atlantica]
MSFVPHAHMGSLIRLFDEMDNYTRDSIGRRSLQTGDPLRIQPRFDVCERQDSYDLYGELPGLEKEDLHLEFTDPKTLLLSGHIERSYTTGTPTEGFTAVEKPPEKAEQKTTGKPVGRSSQEQPTPESGKGASGESAETGKQVAPAKEMGPKYWVAERSIGEFSRAFNFAHRVSPDGVTAELKSGVLSVHVPKASDAVIHTVQVS